MSVFDIKCERIIWKKWSDSHLVGCFAASSGNSLKLWMLVPTRGLSQEFVVPSLQDPMFGTKCIANGDFLVLMIESSRTVKSCKVKTTHYYRTIQKRLNETHQQWHITCGKDGIFVNLFDLVIKIIIVFKETCLYCCSTLGRKLALNMYLKNVNIKRGTSNKNIILPHIHGYGLSWELFATQQRGLIQMVPWIKTQFIPTDLSENKKSESNSTPQLDFTKRKQIPQLPDILWIVLDPRTNGSRQAMSIHHYQPSANRRLKIPWDIK